MHRLQWRYDIAHDIKYLYGSGERQGRVMNDKNVLLNKISVTFFVG